EQPVLKGGQVRRPDEPSHVGAKQTDRLWPREGIRIGIRVARDVFNRLQSEEIYIVKLIIGGEIQTSREVRLSRRDETLVDQLIETGISRNIAKTLVFLSKREETTTVEIEKATGLRQPEYIIAMQEQ